MKWLEEKRVQVETLIDNFVQVFISPHIVHSNH